MSLRIEGVSLTIGSAPILHGVDLDLADREVVAVLGPSGSGKTTLLRVIAGLLRPSAGRVIVDGRDVTDVPTHQRGVGLMFQDHALFPHRDVGANVAFGLRMHRWTRPAIASRVAEVLDLVGLAGFDRRAIGGLSGGERQRVALARALAPRPSLLLLDEPLGSLDRALRDRLLDDMAEVLRVSGATVVHVTHDQAEAFATGDRIVVMRDGRVAQVGTPEQVWHRPVDAGVARIVGPVAQIPVQIDADGVAYAPWGVVRTDAGDPVHGDDASAAGAAWLLMRPDDVVVVRSDEPVDDRRLAGVVLTRSFHGDHVIARVRVGDDTNHAEVMVADRSGTIPAVGSPVVLALLRATVVRSEGRGSDEP